MEVADGGKVEDEEQEGAGEQREAVDGDAGGIGGAAEEQGDHALREQHEGGGDNQSADAGADDGEALGLDNAVMFVDAVVEADDGLDGLCDGVADHKDEGAVVAGDAESTDAVVADIVHKHDVTQEHKHSHSGFAQ